MCKKRLYVFDQNIPDVPDENANDNVKDKYDRHIDEDVQATCVMLASMTPELQKKHENMNTRTIIFHLKELFLKGGYRGFVMDHELSVNLVLQPLPPSFAQFIINFNMHKLDIELPELVSMLVITEKSLKKEKVSILLVQSFKAKKNPKKKANIALKPTGGVKKDKGICHHCLKEGH
ncbi:hypothetical protein MANES_18G144816v8 [Manihot esculenta]|uniref:Uncharacterized protein n=1 Tax=Manihot esculenta TaxID=3983 RepID=A0ACB7G4V3_MANES|nr:hypothetical protein MANES_18G144816v8 [Manihot esculenta]